MWLNQSIQYNYKTADAVQKAEQQLNKDLVELKSEIEVNELLYGNRFKKPFSSVAVPPEPKTLANERKFCIERILQVHEARGLYIQADVMKEAIESASHPEYTVDNIPILLHQFFIDRVSWCVYSKHAHLLRWKRFGQHVEVIEELYPDFRNRMGYILSEYNDSLQRAKRLSKAHEAYLDNNINSNLINYVQTEDVEIYLRWLIAHFHSTKSYTHFMKLLEWFPLLNSSINKEENKQTDRESLSTKLFLSKPDEHRNYSESVKSNGPIDYLYLSSTTPFVPTEDTLNALSFLFSEGDVPMFDNRSEFILPRLRYFVNFYQIEYNINNMQSSGDEMELYAAVNRKFRHLFSKQEQMKTFKVYDTLEIGHENWGVDSPIHALKKEANWTKFIRILARKDPFYEKTIAKLRNKHKPDELLVPHSKFLEFTDDERVLSILRQNAPYAKYQPNIEAVSVVNNKTTFNSSTFWKNIFVSIQAQEKQENEAFLLSTELALNSAQKISKGISFAGKPSNKKSNEYNYMENLQKFGLDDMSPNEQGLTGINGSTLSYIMLRHLKIRDLKRQALGVLNYFRSIERTMTIYDGGLSVQAKSMNRQSPQNQPKETAGGANLGNHSYIYNTPEDFKISEMEFMEFTEIENHDDFYTTDNLSNVHVQDHRGYYIVYDVALEDLKKLEDELLLKTSFYIEKDKENCKSRSQTRETKSPFDRKSRLTKTSFGTNTPAPVDDVDLVSYSHQHIDRFAALLDIWTNEVGYLEMKRQLISIYYEIYLNTFDKQERHNIAQVLTDLIYQRPRIDLEANYFVGTYQLEISCLYKKIQITKLLAERMLNDMKELSVRLNGNVKYGLPYKLVKKKLITPHLDQPVLKNMFMLEFYPEFAVLGRIPEAMKHVIQDMIYKLNIENVNETLAHEKEFLASLYERYQNIEKPGSSFLPHIQKEVFNGIFIEDPFLMEAFMQNMVKAIKDNLRIRTRKDEMALQVSLYTLEVVTLRQRLLTELIQTEFLTKIYQKQTTELGFDQLHVYLRNLQFEFARLKEMTHTQPPLVVTELTMEDHKVDRYIPAGLSLAVQELEDSQIGKFSFRAKDGIEQLVKAEGVESLQLVLKLQITHNNLLIGAIQQPRACALSKNTSTLGSKPVSNQIDGQKSNQQVATSASTSQPKIMLSKAKPFAEAFVSLQMEKVPTRDLMLNDFLAEKDARPVIVGNPIETEKCKKVLMNKFVKNFSTRLYQYSLRSQLISLYSSITRLLGNFPITRDSHFVFGESIEKRLFANAATSSTTTNISNDDYADELRRDPNTFKKRPRKLLSDDGRRVLNVWFIPHYTEVLTVFKKHADEQCYQALRNSVRIIGALNDILHFLYANAWLNTEGTNTSSVNSTASTSQLTKKKNFSSWENAGGLGSELNEIQSEMNSLINPCDPEEVACYLELKRHKLLMQFDCAVRFSMRDTFLASGNMSAYNNITENMEFSLKFLSDYPISTFDNVFLDLPEIFDPRDKCSKVVFPWRAFMSNHGIFPTSYWSWFMIEPYISQCVTALKDVEKSIANGEILGSSLMLEDLTTLYTENDQDLFTKSEDINNIDVETMFKPKQAVKIIQNEDEEGRMTVTPMSRAISRMDQSSGLLVELPPNYPIQNYARMIHFIINWKRLELIKKEWGRQFFEVEEINNTSLYLKYCDMYRKEILLPLLRSLVAKGMEAKDFMETVAETGPIILPKGISDLEAKTKQISKLLERITIKMVSEIQNRLQKEMRIVMNERSREENSLTTDLWKKGAMKEEFTITRPHIADKFAQLIFSSMTHNPSNSPTDENSENTLTITESNLIACLSKLGSMVLERERSNYEQYTTYFENLLRQHHQTLYSREREVLSMKEALQNKTNEMEVEVKCQMTEACYDLIMEVTALRAKLLELTEYKTNMEKEIREQIKEEYIDLVTDLANANTILKSHFDIYRESLYNSVLKIVSNIRDESFGLTQKIKEKYNSNSDEFSTIQERQQAKIIVDLQEENELLSSLMIKHKLFSKIQLNKSIGKFTKESINIKSDASKISRQSIQMSLMAEQKETLLEQQKAALEKQLKKLEVEYNQLKNRLDKEVHAKARKEHETHQKIKNERNLHSAKQSNVEKLFMELESKDAELRNLHLNTERHLRSQTTQDTKLQKEMTTLKRQLLQERNLKLDAFQKVDELQTHVYDLEDELTNIIQIRPQTSKESRIIDQRSNLSSAASINRYRSPFPRLTTLPSSALFDGSKSSSGSPNIKPIKTENKVRINDNYTNGDPILSEQFSKTKQTRLKSAV